MTSLLQLLMYLYIAVKIFIGWGGLWLYTAIIIMWYVVRESFFYRFRIKIKVKRERKGRKLVLGLVLTKFNGILFWCSLYFESCWLLSACVAHYSPLLWSACLIGGCMSVYMWCYLCISQSMNYCMFDLKIMIDWHIRSSCNSNKHGRLTNISFLFGS